MHPRKGEALGFRDGEFFRGGEGDHGMKFCS